MSSRSRHVLAQGWGAVDSGHVASPCCALRCAMRALQGWAIVVLLCLGVMLSFVPDMMGLSDGAPPVVSDRGPLAVTLMPTPSPTPSTSAQASSSPTPRAVLIPCEERLQLAGQWHAESSCHTPIALLKTHKTGSATLAGMLFASSLCSRCSIYDQPKSGGIVHMPPADWMVQDMASWPRGGAADRLIFHYSGDGSDAPSPWSLQRRELLRMVPDGAFVTSLRDPVTRYISALLYFYEPVIAERSGSAHNPAEWVAQTARTCGYANVMARKFGLRSTHEVDDFVQSALPSFGGLVLQDRFDESLVVMALRLRLRVEDIVYFAINTSGDTVNKILPARGAGSKARSVASAGDAGGSLSALRRMGPANQSDTVGLHRRLAAVARPTPSPSTPADQPFFAVTEPGWAIRLPRVAKTVRWDRKRVLETPKLSSLGQRTGPGHQPMQRTGCAVVGGCCTTRAALA